MSFFNLQNCDAPENLTEKLGIYMAHCLSNKLGACNSLATYDLSYDTLKDCHMIVGQVYRAYTNPSMLLASRTWAPRSVVSDKMTEIFSIFTLVNHGICAVSDKLSEHWHNAKGGWNAVGFPSLIFQWKWNPPSTAGWTLYDCWLHRNCSTLVPTGVT